MTKRKHQLQRNLGIAVCLLALALPIAWTDAARAATRFGGINPDVTFDDGDLTGKGRLGTLAPGDRGAAARLFLLNLSAVPKAGGEDFTIRSVTEDALGQLHIRLQQTIHGIPVQGADLGLHADARSGEVYFVAGHFAPNRQLPTRPKIKAATALETALGEMGVTNSEFLSDAELTYVTPGHGKAYLAWAAKVRYIGASGIEEDVVFADATNGMLVTRHPQIHRARYRQTYTANNGTSLPGTLLFSEGGSSSDPDAMDAYDFAGNTYDFYWTQFGRDSYDNGGATMKSTVHYSSNYNNAFWNGSQMVYGDGDGSTFSPLSGALDVVAHELTHAVTEYSAGLIYQNESGALNEAMSDIMGAATEVYVVGSIDSDTWKLGEDIYTPGTPGDALRYMDNPTADGSSYDYYPERYTGSQDNGGVHWNSGIANLAFHLVSVGGTHPRGKTSINVPAIGIDKAQQIFYRALTVYMNSNTNFAGARDATEQAAADLYTSTEVAAILDAWDAVGVTGPPAAGELANGVPATGLSGATGSLSYFTLEVPAGATDLEFAMSGGTGDADLYVKFGSAPTTSSYDCRPYLNGNNETCTFPSPSAGTWHVMIRGYSSYSGVTLVGSFTESGGGGPCPSCEHYTGSLSGTGDADAQPNGTYYYSGSSGLHEGYLEGPGSADFDLYLYKWNGNGWSQVASSLSSSSSESIVYSGSAGYYYWRILSYSGSGSYDFWMDRP